jgi:ABC-type microcin C transport system permease subunit YejB
MREYLLRRLLLLIPTLLGVTFIVFDDALHRRDPVTNMMGKPTPLTTPRNSDMS